MKKQKKKKRNKINLKKKSKNQVIEHVEIIFDECANDGNESGEWVWDGQQYSIGQYEEILVPDREMMQVEEIEVQKTVVEEYDRLSCASDLFPQVTMILHPMIRQIMYHMLSHQIVLH